MVRCFPGSEKCRPKSTWEGHLGEKRGGAASSGPRSPFQWRIGGIAACGGLFEVWSPLLGHEFGKIVHSTVHVTIGLRTGCAHPGAAGSRRLIPHFTVAGSFSEIAATGISIASFGPKGHSVRTGSNHAPGGDDRTGGCRRGSGHWLMEQSPSYGQSDSNFPGFSAERGRVF
jgi:hypothetical protein